MSQQGYPYPNFTPPSNVAQPNGGGATGNGTTTSQASFALQQLQLLQQQLQQSQQGNQTSNYYSDQRQGPNSYPNQYQQPPQQSYNNYNQYPSFNPQQQQNGYQPYPPFPVQQQPQQSNSMYPVKVADSQTTRVPYKTMGNNNNINRNNGGKFKPNKRPRKCYNCKGYGHVSAECPAKRIESELNYRRINHRPDYASGFGGNGVIGGNGNSSGSGLRCFICNSDLHKVMDCPERKNKDEPFDPNACYVCGSREHRAAKCPDRKNEERCFICNSLGHKVANCPQRHPNNDGQGYDGKKGGCFVCNSHFHKAADCPYKRSEAANSDDENGSDYGFACYVCNSKNHKAAQCPQRKKENETEVVCYLCKKSGHRARDCTEKKDKTEEGIPCCWNCNSTEHKARDCPKLCRVCQSTEHETAKCPTIKNGYYNLVKLTERPKKPTQTEPLEPTKKESISSDEHLSGLSLTTSPLTSGSSGAKPITPSPSVTAQLVASTSNIPEIPGLSTSIPGLSSSAPESSDVTHAHPINDPIDSLTNDSPKALSSKEDHENEVSVDTMANSGVSLTNKSSKKSVRFAAVGDEQLSNFKQFY
ncbi:unnamed protein product [Ambrosiozyma monospora]|uniref:Unnamed protein product n=1 Tax=Ambrosiozyma monospora TaxID=43982 RepID=A0A9W7DE27_AMBMO|nr:unnamed protein product [Ambrosiozyma monospora]